MGVYVEAILFDWLNDKINVYSPATNRRCSRCPRASTCRSARRSSRVGIEWGMPVEDAAWHRPCPSISRPVRLICQNLDLLKQAVKRSTIADPRLKAGLRDADGDFLTIHFETLGLDRVDVATDGRPGMFLDMVDGPHDIRVAGKPDSLIELRGFEGGAGGDATVLAEGGSNFDSRVAGRSQPPHCPGCRSRPDAT